MLKCNLAICTSFNGDCVDANSIRTYLIQLHCRREESQNILIYRFNIQSYPAFTLNLYDSQSERHLKMHANKKGPE